MNRHAPRYCLDPDVKTLYRSPVAADSTITARFELQAHRQPDHVAVVDGGLTINYRNLNAYANRVAHALMSMTFDRSVPVAIAMESSTLQIATALGVLKANGFYVTLDPRNPSERNRFILDQSGCGLVLTRAGQRARISAEADRKVVCVDIDLAAEGHPDVNPVPVATAESLACLIYTSGSTGRPKGVMLTHGSVVSLVDRYARIFQITPADRQSMVYSPAVQGGHRDTYTALLNGASLHLYPLLSEGLADLPRWLRAEKISVFCCVATVLRQLLHLHADRAEYPDLRFIKSGGERTFRADVEEARRKIGGNWSFLSAYGSSEVGLLTANVVAAGASLDADVVPVGYPVVESEFLLLDQHGNSADAGEIVVRSRTIMSGYWRDDTQTRRLLSTDRNDPACRVFRTGDHGRRDTNGCVHLTGRLDFQVKINGNRVQIDEVEANLKHAPSVRDAVVVPRHDADRGDMLVAFVVLRSGEEPASVPALQRYLGERLPGYMVPGAYHWVDALPQLPNGKTDRQLLIQQCLAEPTRHTAGIKPASSRWEREVMRIWTDVLGRSVLSIDDDFFERGGDSLRAMVMIATVAREFGIHLPLAALLQARDVSSFAALMESSGHDRHFDTLVPFRSRGRRRPFFCVHGVYGGVLFLRDLVERLDREQPFHAFQPPNLDGTRFRFETIGEIADHYIDSMKTIQPEGPYSIGGFSFGGKVAFEMARRLQARGDRIQRLVVFDSMPPALACEGPGIRIDRTKDEIGPNARMHLRQLRHHGRSPAAWVAGLLGTLLDLVRPPLQHQWLRLGHRLNLIDRDAYVSWNHRRLLRHYRAEPYHGDVVVFAASGRTEILRSAWSGCVVGRVTVQPVDGDHRGIFLPPNVDRMALHLRQILSGDDAESHSA